MFDDPLSPDTALALIGIIGGLFGLIVGSFANVVIYRLPLGQSIVFPASRCPGCHSEIAPWHNIPVLSWLLLRGRCASCGIQISARYPAVEALHGAGFAGILLVFGLTPFTPFLLLLYFALVVLAFIDWDHQILPDRITLPSLAIGLATSLLPGALISWRESLFASALGYLGFYAVAESYARLRGIEGLGMGDWKLAAMVGSFLGGRRLLLVVFLGSLTGMVYGLIQAFKERRALARDSNAGTPSVGASDANVGAPLVGVAQGQAPHRPMPGCAPLPEGVVDDGPPPIGLYKLPFGTFLAGAAIFVLFFGDFVLDWYAGLFGF